MNTNGVHVGRRMLVCGGLVAVLGVAPAVFAKQANMDKYNQKAVPPLFSAGTDDPSQIVVVGDFVPYQAGEGGDVNLFHGTISPELDWHVRVVFTDASAQRNYGMSADALREALGLNQSVEATTRHDGGPSLFGEWMVVKRWEQNFAEKSFWTYPEILEFMGVAQDKAADLDQASTGDRWWESRLTGREVYVQGTFVDELNDSLFNDEGGTVKIIEALDYQYPEIHPVDSIAYRDVDVGGSDSHVWRVAYFANSALHPICENTCESTWRTVTLPGCSVPPWSVVQCPNTSECDNVRTRSCGERRVVWKLPLPRAARQGDIVSRELIEASQSENAAAPATATLIKAGNNDPSVMHTHLKLETTIPPANNSGSFRIEKWKVTVGRPSVTVKCAESGCVTNLGFRRYVRPQGQKHRWVRCNTPRAGCVRRFKIETVISKNEGVPNDAVLEMELPGGRTTTPTATRPARASFFVEVDPRSAQPEYRACVTARARHASFTGEVKDRLCVALPRPLVQGVSQLAAFQAGAEIAYQLDLTSSTDNMEAPVTTTWTFNVKGDAPVQVTPVSATATRAVIKLNKQTGPAWGGRVFVTVAAQNGFGERAVSRHATRLPTLRVATSVAPVKEAVRREGKASDFLPVDLSGAPGAAAYSYPAKWNVFATAFLSAPGLAAEISGCNIEMARAATTTGNTVMAMGVVTTASLTNQLRQQVLARTDAARDAVRGLVAKKLFCPISYSAQVVSGADRLESGGLRALGDGKFEVTLKAGLGAADCAEVEVKAVDGFGEVAKNRATVCGIPDGSAERISQTVRDSSFKMKAVLDKLLAGRSFLPPLPGQSVPAVDPTVLSAVTLKAELDGLVTRLGGTAGIGATTKALPLLNAAFSRARTMTTTPSNQTIRGEIEAIPLIGRALGGGTKAAPLRKEKRDRVLQQ